MQHSIKEIGERYSIISELRKDNKQFNATDFLAFARKNIDKYSLIESNDDLLVSTWYSNDLIKDYQQQL